MLCQELKENSEEEEVAEIFNWGLPFRCFFFLLARGSTSQNWATNYLGDPDSILSSPRVETVGRGSRSAASPVWSTMARSLAPLYVWTMPSVKKCPGRMAPCNSCVLCPAQVCSLRQWECPPWWPYLFSIRCLFVFPEEALSSQNWRFLLT